MLNVGGLGLSIGQPALNCKQPNDYICFHSLHCHLHRHGRVGISIWNRRQEEAHLSGHLFLRGRSGRDWCDIYQDRRIFHRAETGEPGTEVLRQCRLLLCVHATFQTYRSFCRVKPHITDYMISIYIVSRCFSAKTTNKTGQ